METIPSDAPSSPHVLLEPSARPAHQTVARSRSRGKMAVLAKARGRSAASSHRRSALPRLPQTLFDHQAFRKQSLSLTLTCFFSPNNKKEAFWTLECLLSLPICYTEPPKNAPIFKREPGLRAQGSLSQ